MYCPRTYTDLRKVKVGGIAVYVSESCGGVFLENQTLKLFECRSGERGKALSAHLAKFHNELQGLNAKVFCPLCVDTVMLRRFYSPLHVVEIDECPGCGGIWLDTGELAKLQSLMLNEKERALLRAQLMEECQPSKIEGHPHIRDAWIRRSDKVDKLMDIASYLTNGW
ncbi:TFIIB-type zinc ribbon-containing protein [Bowmanella pacifica]|uniref:Transcription factor zinc-finger domain-containing protein n=1 Tax=Bowmanella pacifica TaxID=502051 RepID=A0A917YTF3_9ALTE|nr:zf-TFIIB domain-containing protein [Bowmanella pacifica]GGO65558.1 hypothetical protein GCM10010982_07650 [Bowmanella pacifica]